MENNYSNIIAPSDGVRRFLCKTSVLVVGLLSAVFCACAFRMNMLEANTLGSTLRSNMLYVAYVMLPLGLLTSAIFARIKAMGMAFSMISLLIATAAAFMLLLNSLASLLREGRMLGISGSLLELLTFCSFFALLVNLVMSCMEFKLQPVIGSVGSVAAVLAMTVTSIRTMLSFSALSFAWKPEFDWSNLGKLVDTDKLRYHAEWIFRSIPRGNATALHAMFSLRLYERLSACLFYAMIIMIFLKYKKEMTAFNKLLAHAGEYVEIPTARIYQNIFGSGARNDGEPVEPKPKKKTGSSLKSRLRDLGNMAKAKEQGLDITDMADDYDARRASEEEQFDYTSDIGASEYADDDELTEEERFIMEKRRMLSRSSGNSDERPRQRRRDSDEFGEDERPRQRRRASDEYGEDERPRQRRRASDEFGEDERPRQRRRSDEFGEDERPRQRRRSDEFGEDERPRQRRRASDEFGEDERPRQRRRSDEFVEDERPRQRRRSDEFGEDERPRQRRRSDEFGEDERPRQRRRASDEFGEDERPRQRRRSDEFDRGERPRQRREMTDQEKYLMEERRKRQRQMNPDGRNERRSSDRGRNQLRYD